MLTRSTSPEELCDILDKENKGIWNGVSYETPKRDKSTGEYHTSEWTIESVGGFITGKHWWAKSERHDIAFWASTKMECMKFINWYMNGMKERIHAIHFKPLY
jgi:hypothetical protein